MQTLASLRGFHEMGVAAMGFNKDGTKLASVGLDQDHSIAIWDWRKAVRLATCPGHTDKIFEARFNPVDDVLVTCGVSHVKFWSMQGDNQLKGKKAVYGQDGLSHTMLCCAFTDAGLALTGGLNGHVFLWKGSHLEWQFEEAHAGPVFALSTYPDGFVSGGKDGRVRLWSGLDPVKIFDFSGTCVASSIATRIRSAAWRDGQVLVGTMSNEIFEVDERSMTQRLIVQSHAGAEVWGLDTHPTQAAFATGGEDATVRIYKMSSRKASMVRDVKRACKTVHVTWLTEVSRTGARGQEWVQDSGLQQGRLGAGCWPGRWHCGGARNQEAQRHLRAADTRGRHFRRQVFARRAVPSNDMRGWLPRRLRLAERL